MAEKQQTNKARPARTAGHLASVYAAPRVWEAQQQPLIAVMSLPDGTEIVLRATEAGWTVTENGVRSTPDTLDTQRNDKDMLEDIAAAYVFGKLRQSATQSAPRHRTNLVKRPKVTLVSSH